MSMLSLRLPESVHNKVRDLAAKESISINQFISTAVAEKMAALLTEEYLEERARRADPAAFDRILAVVPDVPPIPGDERQPFRVDKKPNKRMGRARKTRRSF
ncbi:MAG: toxin-antitoxin system HicB family antitoxin [Deltaproteobacteria bacterium]|nr:toxin-antitoxin system HicB family antitoxin [Deltaproteobacteria bacterium]